MQAEEAIDDETDVSATTPSDVDAEADATEEISANPPRRFAAWRQRAAEVHPALWLTLLGVAIFTVVFGTLGIQHHDNFGTYSFDMGIYDQGFWLTSRGESFMTVRGLDFWGHHINLIVIAFVPFYWLGAGPAFLLVTQAFVIGLGALPVYLITRDRFRRDGMALVFVAVYLLYAPIQWLTHANFHPEALVITPFLFAWWCARTRRWGWFWVAVLVALSTREDTALAVMMMGVVLLLLGGGDRRDRTMAWRTVALGIGWYVIAIKLVIPFFNDGEEPFYIKGYYGHYGDDLPDIAGTILTEPNRIISDATQPDRIRFYRDLTLPLGGMPLLSPITLLMALPQMVASVIGLSPYARMIRFQYTSVMIAPIVISAIEGAYFASKLRLTRKVLPAWLLLSAFVSNVAWSPSPIGDHFPSWMKDSPRNEVLRDALDLVPDDAAVTATYGLLPHLSHRKQIYDWPNPFVSANWGDDDCEHLPDPAIIEYIAIDRNHVGDEHQAMLDSMVVPGGPFQLLLLQDDVLVAKRIGVVPAIDVDPQAESCPDPDG